jgi:hypothetical protein
MSLRLCGAAVAQCSRTAPLAATTEVAMRNEANYRQTGPMFPLRAAFAIPGLACCVAATAPEIDASLSLFASL